MTLCIDLHLVAVGSQYAALYVTEPSMEHNAGRRPRWTWTTLPPAQVQP